MRAATARAPDRQQSVHVEAPVLHQFASDILVAAGLREVDASTVADCLVTADLWGIESHGVSRLPIYARRISKGVVNGSASPHVLGGSRSALLLIDGDNGPGAMVGRFAMDQTIAAAKTFGVAFAVARRSNHFGVAAYFARMAAAQNCIGICGTNAPVTMAVWGAREPALGTNPLALAAPAGRYGELRLDMSSSVVAKGKILVHARKGLPIPPGWALDAAGEPTTDAQAAADGVVLPFGGPKGSGLSLFIDLISGVLSGAAFAAGIRDQYTDFETAQDVGHFFAAIDIASVMPVPEYEARVEEFLRQLKAKTPASGISEILLPGEVEARHERERRQNGIPIDRGLAAELDQLARSVCQRGIGERLAT